MSLLRHLFGWGGLGREAAEPIAPPSAAPVMTLGEEPKPAPLSQLLAAAEFGDPEMWAKALILPMRQNGIHPPRRAAAFLATIAHESNGGRRLVEDLHYRKADRIMAVFGTKRFPTRESAEPFVANPKALAERVYGGRLGNGPEGAGDGWKFRGRGLIQMTGRDNYSLAAVSLGRPQLRDNPDTAAEPEMAAWLAAWWWAAHGCNDLADAGDPVAWRKRVNGPAALGLDDVRRRYTNVLAAIGGPRV